MSMALEYPVKMIILIIVVFVAIALISDFYMRSQITINDVIPDKDEKGDIVAQSVDLSGSGTLNENDIEKYCRLCKTVVEDYEPANDAVCYILKGRFSPSSFPTSDCDFWDCGDWLTARNVIISYDWRESQVTVEC